jgi:hypothetical protein
MKAFISWSGELSKELGEIFSKWIPSVLQSVKPYFTPEGVEKGARWSTEIAKELEESRIGIIILTRENLLEPWIMFEAGALSKELERSRICPVLFGVANSDLVGPLVQFQATSFRKEEMKKLVKSINNACDENKLADSIVDNVFEKWWPDLEEQVGVAMGKERENEDKKSRSDRAIIEEILDLSRASVSRNRVELSEYLAPETIDQLYITYRELRDSIKSKDLVMLESACDRMGVLMDDILNRRVNMVRARKEWEARSKWGAWMESEDRRSKFGQIGEEPGKEE